MTGAAKTCPASDFGNRQVGFMDQQLARGHHASGSQVFMRRHSDGLPKRAFKVARAEPADAGELAQSQEIDLMVRLLARQ